MNIITKIEVEGLQPLPTKPGSYFWDEWNCVVNVFLKPRSKKLWVAPPGGLPVAITPKIAGNFTLIPEPRINPIEIAVFVRGGCVVDVNCSIPFGTYHIIDADDIEDDDGATETPDALWQRITKGWPLSE